jgi:hypothetical protein
MRIVNKIISIIFFVYYLQLQRPGIETARRLVFDSYQMVPDHHLELVVDWGKVPLAVDLDESAEGRVETAQQDLSMVEYQLALLVTDHPLGELDVAVSALTDFDRRTVVEVDYVFFYLCSRFVFVAENHERRVNDAFTVNYVFFAFVDCFLFNFALADLTTEIVFEVFIAIRGPSHRS